MNVRSGLEDLTLFIEDTGKDFPIVEFMGDFYWIGEGSLPEGFSGVEGELEINEIPAMRRAICSVVRNPVPWREDNPDGKFSYEAGYFADDNDGVLPDSTKRYIKKVLNPEVLKEFQSVTPYVEFDLDRESQVCFRNTCHDCPAQEICKVSIEIL